MKKLPFLFSILFLTVLLISCSTAPKFIADNSYSEKKEKIKESHSEKYGDLLDSYTALDDIYSLYCSRQDEQCTYTITKSTRNNDNEQLIPLELDESINFLFIRADMYGDILLSDTTTVYVFKNGETYTSLSFPAWSAGGMLITNENFLICQAFKDSAYYLFSLSTGERKGTFLDTDFLFEQGKCQPFLCGTDKEQFLLTGAGIYEYTDDIWELRVPSGGTSLFKSVFLAKGIEKGEYDTWIVYASDYQYTYSPKKVNEEERRITLRVTAWQDRYTLKAALAEYQIANPNVTIEYTFRCTDLPETVQESNTLLQKANSELVSSQAADLYVLDHLPWEEYREKGVLMDLSEIVQPYAEDEEYFGKILTAYQTTEGLYAVPWFFSAKFVVCRKELAAYVQSIYSLAAYLEAHPEDSGIIPYYYRNKPELFLAMMYDFYAKDLYESDIVTLENVERFLKAAKIIYDRQQENSTATILPDYEKYSYSYLQQYPCGVDLQLLFEKEEGSFLLLPATPMGATDLLKLNNYPDYTLVPIDGIHSQFLFGIHSQSKEKEAAAEFLQYLLAYYKETGEEDLSLAQFGFLPGFPVYKPLLLGRFEEYTLLEEPDSVTHASIEKSSNSAGEDVIKLLGEFQTPGYSADVVTDAAYAIFQERCQGYLTGEQSLEETSKNVYDGLMLFYHETH